MKNGGRFMTRKEQQRADFEEHFYATWPSMLEKMTYEEMEYLNTTKLADINASYPETMLWLKHEVLLRMAMMEQPEKESITVKAKCAFQEAPTITIAHSNNKPASYRQVLQLGDVIEWDGEQKIVTKIEGDYAVWYAMLGMKRRQVAKLRVYDYGDNIRVIGSVNDKEQR